MKIRIRIDASFNPTDTTSINQLRNGVIALQGAMQRVNAVETSTIDVEQCNHDTGGGCTSLYHWEKT